MLTPVKTERLGRPLFGALVFLLVSAACARGQALSPVTVAVSAPADYTPGTTIELVIELANPAEEEIRALGLVANTPEGWTFTGARAISGALPAVAPAVGTSDKLEFAWLSTPTFPYRFAISLAVPEAYTGNAALTAQVETRGLADSELSELVSVTVPQAVPEVPGFFARLIEWFLSLLRSIFGVFLP